MFSNVIQKLSPHLLQCLSYIENSQLTCTANQVTEWGEHYGGNIESGKACSKELIGE